MANGWTAERRRKQSQLMMTTRPWERSTGPKTEQGKANSSRNAFKGGFRQQIQDMRKLLKAQQAQLETL